MSAVRPPCGELERPQTVQTGCTTPLVAQPCSPDSFGEFLLNPAVVHVQTQCRTYSCTGKGNSPRKVYTANSKQSSLSNGSAITRAQTAVKWTHSKATLMTSAKASQALYQRGAQFRSSARPNSHEPPSNKTAILFMGPSPLTQYGTVTPRMHRRRSQAVARSPFP